MGCSIIALLKTCRHVSLASVSGLCVGKINQRCLSAAQGAREALGPARRPSPAPRRSDQSDGFARSPAPASRKPSPSRERQAAPAQPGRAPPRSPCSPGRLPGAEPWGARAGRRPEQEPGGKWVRARGEGERGAEPGSPCRGPPQ
jgi:hypothetical protein